ncbi:MAG: choice-of-anchor V domain-containing protein [Bacteroidota bacterium]
MMKKRYTISILLLIGILSIAGTQFSSQFPTRRSKAPGESSCGGCHSGNVNTGSGSNQLSLPADYIPDSTYTLSFTLNDNTFPSGKNGFTITALDGNNLKAGDFGVITSGNTAVLTGSVGGQTRQYVGHRNASTNQTWNFTWKAPATNVGDITFYIVGNAANGNGSTSGDFIYESNQTLSLDPTVVSPDFTIAQLQACQGESVSFTNSSSGPVDSYLWDFGPNASPATSTSTTPPSVQFNTGGTQTITLTAFGPNDTVSISKTLEISDIKIDGIADVSICVDAEVQPNISVRDGFAPYSYMWSSDSLPIGGISDPTAPNPILAPNTSDQVTIRYSVSVMDDQGCGPVTGSFDVTVNAIPLVSPGPDTTYCEGEGPITLRATTLGSNQALPPFTYVWSPLTSNTDTLSVDPAIGSTAYSLEVVSAAGCSTSLNDTSNEVIVTVLENPAPTITLDIDSLKTSSDGSAYQWFTRDVNSTDFLPIAGQTGSSLATDILPSEFEGEVQVQITNPNGCTNVSEPFSLTLTSIVTGVARVELFPNPTATELWIKTGQKGRFRLISFEGKVVKSAPIAGGTQRISVTDLAAGLYIMEMWIGEQKVREKIWIE